MKKNSIEEDIKNLSEIIELCEEEINNNDENVSAILDLTDLKSLRNLIKEYKNLKEIEENHRKENGELREQVKELEEENKKLKDNYKNQIEHTTILAKALNLEEDAPIDEMYAEINKLKTNSIPTLVIQNKIDELIPIVDKYEKQIENDEETDLSYEEVRNYACKIEVLQELLESEE